MTTQGTATRPLLRIIDLTYQFRNTAGPIVDPTPHACHSSQHGSAIDRDKLHRQMITASIYCGSSSEIARLSRLQLGRCPCLGAYLTVSVAGSASQSRGVTRVGNATSSELASGATLVGSKELTPEDNKPRAGYGRLAAHTRTERTPSGQRRNTLAPTCPSGHVAAWEGGAKVFVYGERTVRLAFSAWLTRANVYSLTVELGTLGQEQ